MILKIHYVAYISPHIICTVHNPQVMTDFTLNKSYFDMATATKMVAPLSGSNGEDINEWIKIFHLTTTMIGLNSEDSRRLLAASMRGTATSWLAKIIIQDPQASLETILSSFKMRFTSKEKVAKLARKIFTETSRIRTTADLHSIIEDATYVYQARHLGTEALIGAISPRLPDVLKDKMWEACTVCV